jgi:hypothetical protein
LTILKGYPKVLGRPEWKEVLRRWKKLEKAVPRDPEEEPSPSNFITPWTTPGTWSRPRGSGCGGETEEVLAYEGERNIGTMWGCLCQRWFDSNYESGSDIGTMRGYL